MRDHLGLSEACRKPDMIGFYLHANPGHEADIVNTSGLHNVVYGAGYWSVFRTFFRLAGVGWTN